MHDAFPRSVIKAAQKQKHFYFKQMKYFKILSSSPKWESITIYVSVMSI